MSAETMKIPEPIIEPATMVAESNNDNPAFSSLDSGRDESVAADDMARAA